MLAYSKHNQHWGYLGLIVKIYRLMLDLAPNRLPCNKHRLNLIELDEILAQKENVNQ